METKKRFLSILLSLTMMLGLMPGMALTAQAADNSTDYTVTIPATLTVANSGWNATDGITAAVKSGDTFHNNKQLTVTATSTNSWALKSGDNSVGYNLATATGTYNKEATPASWKFTATQLNKTNGTTKPMGIIVEDYSNKPAGTYQDTVTFTASVEDALYNVNISPSFDNDNSPTITATSGSLSQTGVTGAMETVTVEITKTWQSFFKFQFNDITINGVTAHCVDAKTATVSGTPTDDVNIILQLVMKD